METRKFKDLTIRDAFMFAAVMSDPEICRRVLELALGIPISEVHIQTEKTAWKRAKKEYLKQI